MEAPHEEDEDEDGDLGIEALLQQASQDFFSYESFTVLSDHEVEFVFSFSGVSRFRSRLRLEGPHGAGLDLNLHGAALFHIGLCILPWFWMGFAVPRVVIRAGYLSPDQVRFWEHFYLHCLAEFYYVNGLDIKSRAIQLHVEAPVAESMTPTYPPAPPRPSTPQRRVLVPLGGGKDSIVVWESICKQAREKQEAGGAMELVWCYVGDGFGEYSRHRMLHEVARISGGQVLLVEHQLVDPKWEACRRRTLELCGHPWAALCALDSVLACLVWGWDDVAVGNERSADEGNNVTHQGVPVNHQYDKSSSFERSLRGYIRRYIAEGVTYFSALGHLWELEIMRWFCRHCSRYKQAFVSCNEVEAGGERWCRGCAKCLFVFTLLSAFLPPEEATGVVGTNMFQDGKMEPMLLSLLGESEGGVKPLECVGTPQEVRQALRLARRRYAEAAVELPPLLRDLGGEGVDGPGELGTSEEAAGGGSAEREGPSWWRPLVPDDEGPDA